MIFCFYYKNDRSLFRFLSGAPRFPVEQIHHQSHFVEKEMRKKRSDCLVVRDLNPGFSFLFLHNINFCPNLLPFCIAQQFKAIISSWSYENSEPCSPIHLLSTFRLFWALLFNSRDLVLKESSPFNSSASTQSRGHLCTGITEVRTNLQ